VIAYPLHTMTVLFTGKDVETNLRPTGQALGNFERLVQLVVGGIHAIDLVLLPVWCVVGMELNHGALWLDRAGAVDLNFIVALCAKRLRTPERAQHSEHAQPITHIETTS
jgi:hypothetical protein